MSKWFLSGWLAVLVLAVVLVSGCGKEGDKTIAQVGNENITVDDYKTFIENVHYSYGSAQEEFDKKKELLDTLVVLRMLVQAAYEKGLDKSEEIARVVLANKDKFLLDVLYDKNIVQKSPVSDAEMQDFWNRLEYKVRASQILMRTLDSAQLIVTKLTAGENFDQLAYDLSADPAAKRNRGDLGYFTWGAFPPQLAEFEQAIFSLEPGEVSPPVKTPYGYHVIKLVDRQPNDMRGPFNEMKEELFNRVVGNKRMKLMQEYLDELRKKYPITVDRTTCDYVLHKREQLYPPQLLASLPKNDFDDTQLDRNERELVMATWAGGPVTLYEYLTLARQSQVPAVLRPDFDMADSLTSFIFQIKLNDILVYEANQTGIENDDTFKKKIKLFREWTMADVMRNDSIPHLPIPDDATVRKYYDDHPEEFTNPAKVHVYEILMSDEMLAARLAKSIKSLEEFKKMAAQYTERPAQRGKDGDLQYIERKWFPEVFDLAWKTPVGAIGGPVVTVGRYSIFYVIDKMDAELKDFIPVKRDIMQKLASNQKIEEFQQWVKERKAAMTISTSEDVLWSLIDKTRYTATDTTAAAGR